MGLRPGDQCLAAPVWRPAGIRVRRVDERGTSSTCPHCEHRISKPRGRAMTCQHRRFTGHRDLAAALTIATRTPGAFTTPPATGGMVTHRRAGRHLPGVRTARRDPRRRPPRSTSAGSPGRRRPAPPSPVGSRSPTPVSEDPQQPPKPNPVNFVDTALAELGRLRAGRVRAVRSAHPNIDHFVSERGSLPSGCW
ncbi:hypothetical protein DMB66_10925 [Actinoplanes sp. ATCC 53533]|uniref:zinc ribbon domain-containing protein n=1 Tax=Actinoplanes sp. ATCC 53533 TaxID=1288362 RepID=UPI000F7A47E1|nr:hypothetical protein DMB66_10925 [Actinoplanes sp. ATCC 53533]